MNAFWRLYMVNPIEKITISAITKSANIHRSTFYEYFKDIYDVLEQFEDDLFEYLEHDLITMVKETVKNTNTENIFEDFNQFIEIPLTFYAKYGEQIYRLSSTAGDPVFRDRLYEFFKKNFMNLYKTSENEIYADYLSTFIFSIILNGLKYWIEHNETITMQEVVVLTCQIFQNGLQPRN